MQAGNGDVAGNASKPAGLFWLAGLATCGSGREGPALPAPLGEALPSWKGWQKTAQITCSKCKKIIPQKEKKSAHQPFTACCSSPLRHRSPQLKSLLDVFSEIASRPNGLVHFVWKILRIPQAIPPETPLRAALLGCSYSLHITLNETSLQINVWFYLYYQATREGF